MFQPLYNSGESVNKNMNKNYEDIINIDYKGSLKHKHMPRIDRAAQFAPFAALKSPIENKVQIIDKEGKEE